MNHTKVHVLEFDNPFLFVGKRRFILDLETGETAHYSPCRGHEDSKYASGVGSVVPIMHPRTKNPFLAIYVRDRAVRMWVLHKEWTLTEDMVATLSWGTFGRSFRLTNENGLVLYCTYAIGSHNETNDLFAYIRDILMGQHGLTAFAYYWSACEAGVERKFMPQIVDDSIVKMLGDPFDPYSNVDP